MLAAARIIEPHNAELEAMEQTPDLERTVRALLDAVGGLPESDIEPRITFEVRVDGQPYTVCIVAAMPETDAGCPRLSPRELEIARLIAKGLANKTIAAVLGLRPCTVSTYTKRIYLKLNVNCRAEMVAKLLSERSLRFYPLGAARNPN